jgi:two-component system, chemotaxis family, CheB/CheR fusion protein
LASLEAHSALDEAGTSIDVIGPDSIGGDDAAFQGFVVAVGASAGGLDALERLFSSLPPDSGAAFVVIQHLSPDHKSMMDNLLARYTRMPVCVAEEGMALTANAVFLIPPGKTMQLSGERLHLNPKPEHGLSLPIDIFFTSLAEQRLDRAIAVVLSGTGSDGSRGLAAVNANGGFVFVQEPKSAKFDGMPRSAIATGLVDVIATAEELALRVVRHLSTPRTQSVRLEDGQARPLNLKPLEAILDQLLDSCGIDFHEYKPNTVLRRIERRMQVLHAPTLADYHERLATSVDEQALLRRELLIPVTRFFRDGEAFDALAEEVIPALTQLSGHNEPIRIWVACCATGEEAYSVAILFAEAFERAGRARAVKIFATDVEQQYLDQAALGFYPETIAAEVTAARLERYFTPRPGGYTVRPEIRQMVIFARHNLVADPPFTRMDLVSCRNALIYFQPAAQERALRRLQYALRLEGCLLLGPSESLGAMHADFSTLRGRQKVYRLTRRSRIGGAVESVGRHRLSHERGRVAPNAGHAASAPEGAARWVDAGQRCLLQSYTPPTLLIGEGRELLHVYGDASGLLQINEGQATLDVLRLLPRELAWAASLLLQSLSPQRVVPGAGAGPALAPSLPQPQRSSPLRFVSDKGEQQLVMVARAVPSGDAAVPRSLVLLSFEPVSGQLAVGRTEVEQSIEQQQLVERLEAELDRTRESLQAIEELEASNEELQATNEEMMASNEELQSTNEELQSVNEELYTVNSEYQEKVDLLNSVNADLENVSKAAGIPTVFVDEALRLTRITPEAAVLFKVRELDIGRSIEDFAHTLEYPELFSDLRRTVATGIANEREVKSRSGDWWLARLHPYAGRSASSSRAVMTFFNITSVKDSQRLQAIVDSLPEHLAVLDARGAIVLVNEAWRRFAVANGDTDLRGCGPGSNYLKVCADAALGQDEDAQRAFAGMSEVLAGRKPIFTMQYPCHTAHEQRWFLMHVAPVGHPVGGAVVSHIDITSWMLRNAAAEKELLR